jgi:DNA-binding CsgD family transcriptional regulator
VIGWNSLAIVIVSTHSSSEQRWLFARQLLLESVPMVYAPSFPANGVVNVVVNTVVNDSVVNDSNSPFSLLEVILATLMDAVMIVNPDGTIVQANAKATQLCDRLCQESASPHATQRHANGKLPNVIQPLFAALLESRELFPEQRILPEFELSLSDRTPLRIRGQFLDLPRATGDVPYVLITIENRQESLNSVAIGDAQRFGFTARETEVWYMRLLGRSYREIATMLFITENTVRKHVKSVLAKRRVEFDQLA